VSAVVNELCVTVTVL